MHLLLKFLIYHRPLLRGTCHLRQGGSHEYRKKFSTMSKSSGEGVWEKGEWKWQWEREREEKDSPHEQ
jgi:hypothetical protein